MESSGWAKWDQSAIIGQLPATGLKSAPARQKMIGKLIRGKRGLREGRAAG
ncbi:hypothetical protein [uncultured Zoogloea sp.]|uniref:hypothetical protein n=1 Tax=uncultured Zoogloea sp. TaxID=160237 RepID=UPI002616EA28|nr:hypothetical protein [uncultured Zoogloea sp.]